MGRYSCSMLKRRHFVLITWENIKYFLFYEIWVTKISYCCIINSGTMFTLVQLLTMYEVLMWSTIISSPLYYSRVGQKWTGTSSLSSYFLVHDNLTLNQISPIKYLTAFYKSTNCPVISLIHKTFYFLLLWITLVAY